MTITRRKTLQLLSTAAGAGLAGSLGLPAWGADPRALHAQVLGYTLSIHIPGIAGLRDGLPELGYAPPITKRIESMQVLTQILVAGATEVGESDVVSALRASNAGADLRLIGLVYNNTSQVVVVNSDKIKTFEDFKNPENVIAMNSKGDFLYVMLSGLLARHGIDINKATLVEVGGSGSRMRALLAGRVAAVPVHFDQAAKIVKQGNFKVMIKPWDVFNPWLSEAWLVNGAWLDDKKNQRMATDLVKAVIKSFRLANRDLGYFADKYRKYATVKHAKTTTDEQLRPIWSQLVNDIKAWPDDGGFKRSYFQKLVPTYKAAGALSKDPDLNKVVDTRFVEAALKELG